MEEDSVYYCILPQTSVTVNMTTEPPGIFIYGIIVGLDNVDAITKYIDEFYAIYGKYLTSRPSVTISTKHDELGIYDVGVDMEFKSGNLPGDLIESIIKLVELFRKHSI